MCRWHEQSEFIMKGDFLLLASEFAREKETFVEENGCVAITVITVVATKLGWLRTGVNDP